MEQAAYVEIKILLQKTLASTIRKGVFTERAVCGIQVLAATGPEEGLAVGVGWGDLRVERMFQFFCAQVLPVLHLGPYG